MRRGRIHALLGFILIMLGFIIEFYGCVFQQNDIVLILVGLWLWQAGVLSLIGFIVEEFNEQKRNELILSRALNKLLSENESDKNK